MLSSSNSYGYISALLVLICLSKSNGFLLYGDPCDPNEVNIPDLTCDPFLGLNCLEGTCECLNPSDMIVNGTTGGCDTLIGSYCESRYNQSTIDLPCVAEARCREDPSDRDGARCTCPFPSSPLDDLTSCKLSHSAPCQETVDCNEDEGLVCVHGMCQCPNPLVQDEDGSGLPDGIHILKCYARTQSECNPDGNGDKIQCNPNTSLCIPDSNTITGFSCACDEEKGYVQDFNRRCRKGYQQFCNISSADETPSNYCNLDVGLWCVEDKCVCRFEPDQIWDAELKVCGSIEGRPCGYSLEGAFPICQSGLKCVFDRGPIEGICRKPQ